MPDDTATPPTPQTEMRLHVPEPAARPGEDPDFTFLAIPPIDEAPRPPVDAPAPDTYDLATTLIRVLDDNGRAGGAWDPTVPGPDGTGAGGENPALDAPTLRLALEHMITTRLIEEQFMLLQ